MPREDATGMSSRDRKARDPAARRLSREEVGILREYRSGRGLVETPHPLGMPGLVVTVGRWGSWLGAPLCWRGRRASGGVPARKMRTGQDGT